MQPNRRASGKTLWLPFDNEDNAFARVGKMLAISARVCAIQSKEGEMRERKVASARYAEGRTDICVLYLT